MDDQRKPSQVTGDPWIWAQAPPRTGDLEPNLMFSGKWLLFIPEVHADEAWAQVRDATAAGNLGRLAKVATAGQDHPGGKVVMCVYTEDCRDLADVTRVLAGLRNLGHGGRLNYKEDLATRAGRYAGSDGPASLYTSSGGTLIRTLRPVTAPG